MSEERNGEAHQSDAGAEAKASVAPGQINAASDHGPRAESKSYDTDLESHKGRNGPFNLFHPLTINQWLTFFVGFASLVVSMVSCKNAADTSDVKSAVTQLATLAADTKRAADASQQQLKILRESKRAWLVARLHLIKLVKNSEGGIDATYSTEVINVGNAVAEFIWIYVDLQPAASDPRLTGFPREECDGQRDAWWNISKFNNYGSIFPGETKKLGITYNLEAKFPIQPLQNIPLEFAGCLSYGGKYPQLPYQTELRFSITTPQKDDEPPDVLAFPTGGTDVKNFDVSKLIVADEGTIAH